MGHPFGHFVRLLILTAQRRREVSRLEWQKIDLHAETWVQDAADNKSGTRHIVPLSPQALEVLEDITPTNGFIFTGRTGKPITGFSKPKTRLDGIAQVSGWTLHDLRRTAATHLASEGVPLHVVELVLNHRSQSLDGVCGIYNRYNYLKEQRQALGLWGQYISTLSKF
jgi:integrase